MNKHTTKRSVSALAALLLIGVFGTSILFTLLVGANMYQKMTHRDRQIVEDRIRTQFIATSVRQASESEAVTVGTFGDGDALMIRQEIHGEAYLTRIYCYNGWLMQLFAEEDEVFAPQDGEKIVSADQMLLRRDHNLLQAEFLCEGRTSRIWLYLPAGEEVAA